MERTVPHEEPLSEVVEAVEAVEAEAGTPVPEGPTS
jgi:hypothetical protein